MEFLERAGVKLSERGQVLSITEHNQRPSKTPRTSRQCCTEELNNRQTISGHFTDFTPHSELSVFQFFFVENKIGKILRFFLSFLE